LPFAVDHITSHRQRKTAHWGASSGQRLLLACFSSTSQPLLFCGDFRFHLSYHLCQQFFALGLAVGIDISGVLFTVRPDGGVAPFPEAFIDLSDASCASLAALSFVSLEGAGDGFLRYCVCFWLWLSFANALVNFCRRCFPHLVRDMGVYVQRSAAGHVANDGGEGLDIHPVR